MARDAVKYLRGAEIITALDQGLMLEQENTTSEYGWTRWRLHAGNYQFEFLDYYWMPGKLSYADLHGRDRSWRIAVRVDADETC